MALELVERQGYDRTTVAEIAAAAGVSHMTFFRHFPTKEDVLLDDPYDPVIADAVRARPEDLSAMERVRSGLLAAWSVIEIPPGPEMRTRLRIAAATPALRARMWQNTRATEDLIVATLRDTGVARGTARVVTAACLGGLTAALLDWALDEAAAGEPLDRRMRQALTDLASADRP